MPASTHFQMRSGNPHISETDIHQRLTNWITSTNNQRQIGLEALVLVDEFITRPDTPSSENSREFALDNLICFIIEDELLHQRGVLNLTHKTPKNVSEAKTHIRDDAQSNASRLIGWSFLYHCYVRRDLNISLEDFREIIGVVDRSLRRYRTQAIHQLTNSLIYREQTARANHQRRLLFAELPAAIKNIRLFGREDSLNHVYDVIQHKFESTILISGGVGVGKTAFVVQVMEDMISGLRLDYIIWINAPKNLDEIYQTITYKLKLNETHLLKEWLSLYRVAIVLDNAEQIIDMIDDLSVVFSHTLLFIISPQQIQSRNIDSVIVLQELKRKDAHALIAYASQHAVHPAGATNIDDIYRQTGGNPSAILLHLQNIAYDWDYQQGFDKLFDVIYSDLTDLSRDLWLLIGLLGSGSVKHREFTALFPMFLSENWQDLFRYFLCFRSDEHIALHSVAYAYIGIKAQNEVFWRKYLDALTQNLVKSPQYALELLNNLLNNRMISPEDNLHDNWVISLIAYKQELGMSQEWMNYFGTIQSKMPEAKLAKANICRRRLEWSKALAEISGLSLHSSHPLYVECQLEKAILNRYQGNHQKTLEMLNDIYRLPSPKAIKNEIYFEYARMYLDLRDGEMAQQYLLKTIPLESQKTQHLILYINTLLQMNKATDSIRQLQKLIATETNRTMLGIAYDALGRCLFDTGNLKSAEECFQTALEYHPIDNPLAISRSMSNLGAALVRLNDVSRARDTLIKAADIQTALNDVVGLLVTEKNLALLNDKRSYHE